MFVPVTTSDIPEPTPAPALPPEVPPVSVDEGKAIQKGLHSPEARILIKQAFLAKTAPQEKKFTQATMKAFNKQEKQVVAFLEGGKAHFTPLGDPKSLVSDDIIKASDRLLNKIGIRAQLDDADLIDQWHSLYVAFGMQAAEEIAARYEMAVPDGSAILAWIKKQERVHSKYVNDTTADAIDKILSDLRAEGASIPDMTQAIKEYFGGIGYRAERVARTETISVNNYAAQNTYVENGVKQHEWLATDDSRTRDDHAAADGQVQDIGTPFEVGGEQLMYPGDSAGSPEQTCNCRCALLPVI
jgi:SPP1 gp7 family putative phage head morphogenesis protein